MKLNKNPILFLGLFVELLGWVFYLLPFLNPSHSFIDLFYSGTLQNVTPAGSDALALFIAISGTLMIGFGITIIALGQNFTKQNRIMLLLATSSWYILDSIASFVFGFALNAMSNTLLFLIVLIAIYKTPIDPSNIEN